MKLRLAKAHITKRNQLSKCESWTCAKLKIVEISDFSDFLALKEEWNDVLGRCDHSVFSTWEWLTCWWKHFGTGRKLVLLLAEEDNQIIGIAPFMYSVHTLFGSHRGMIEFIGTPDSDYNNFIVVEKKEECLELFADYLRKLPERWDCASLQDIPETAECLPFLAKETSNLRMFHKCPYMRLPESYEAFLQGLTRNQRKNIWRTSRRVKETFEMEIVDYSELQSFSDGMQLLFELHQKRWESRGLPGIFANQCMRDFNLDIARLLLERKWLSLFLLRLSGRPVSVAYGFKYRQKYYDYITGLDPQYKKHNVGTLLTAMMIKTFIQERLAEYDFMRGAEEYKERWNTLTKWNHKAILVRRGFLRIAEHVLYNEYWRQGRRFEYIVKNAPRTLAYALNKKPGVRSKSSTL